MSEYHVTFLLDLDNNWIEPALTKKHLFDPSDRFSFNLSFDPQQVRDQSIVFVVGYTKILSPDFLTQNDLTLVVHESALPKGRGFAPVQWQVLEGRNSIPVCLIEATQPVDSGDIYGTHSFELDGSELYDEIRIRQAAATIELIENFLGDYPNVTKRPQTGEVSHYPRRTPLDSKLDLDRPLRDQFNLLRICNNEEWPSFFAHKGKKYVLKISVDDSND